MAGDVGFGGSNIDFQGFWAILSESWGAMLEALKDSKNLSSESVQRDSREALPETHAQEGGSLQGDS